jgi:hypothetical protein
MVSLNSYKPNAQIKLNIKIVIKKNLRIIGGMHRVCLDSN